MKWKKFRLSTTGKAEDIVIATLAECGIEGIDAIPSRSREEETPAALPEKEETSPEAEEEQEERKLQSERRQNTHMIRNVIIALIIADILFVLVVAFFLFVL